MMDHFMEELVVKRTRTFNDVLYLFSNVVMVLTALIAFMMISTLLRGFHIILLLIALANGAIAFLLFLYRDRLRTEYEYTFTNGELDIDKIIAQTKRKEMITVQVSKFTAFGRYDQNTPEETADMTVIMATDNIAEHEFYADFQHEDYGNARLVFVPNERVISNIINSLHPSIRSKVKQELQSSYISDLSSDI